MKAETKALVFFITIFAVISLFMIYSFGLAVEESLEEERTFCPDDSMVCKDGTVVSRILPDCQFKDCP